MSGTSSIPPHSGHPFFFACGVTSWYLSQSLLCTRSVAGPVLFLRRCIRTPRGGVHDELLVLRTEPVDAPRCGVTRTAVVGHVAVAGYRADALAEPEQGDDLLELLERRLVLEDSERVLVLLADLLGLLSQTLGCPFAAVRRAVPLQLEAAPHAHLADGLVDLAAQSQLRVAGLPGPGAHDDVPRLVSRTHCLLSFALRRPDFSLQYFTFSWATPRFSAITLSDICV